VTDVTFILITLSVFVIKQNEEKMCESADSALQAAHFTEWRRRLLSQRRECEMQEIYGVDKERNIDVIYIEREIIASLSRFW